MTERIAELIPDKKTLLLLVEGTTDKIFFDRLASQLKNKDGSSRNLSNFVTCKFGGKTLLAQFLVQLMQHQNFKYVDRIWIVRDADYNDSEAQREEGAPKRALKSVNSAIRNAYGASSKNIDPPELQDFMTPLPSRPSFSLLVLPDTETEAEGSLETLLLAALKDDALIPCVKEYITCVKETYKNSEIARNREDKNKMQVLVGGKMIVRDLTRSQDASPDKVPHIYSMKWWKDEKIWENDAFDQAKEFLTQLLDD